MLLMWPIIVLLGVISLILLWGKGSFLIAGYNTASKREKAKYNEKKLCRIIGGGLGITTILLITCTLTKNSFPMIAWLAGAGILIMILVMLVLANTVCKAENPPEIQETEEKRKQAQAMERGVWIFVLIVFAAVGIMLTTGGIAVHPVEEGLRVEATYWKNRFIAYDDIQSAEYVENLGLGYRDGGFGSFKLEMGHFRNSSFDGYTLYSYIRCKSYLVLHTEQEVIVLNTGNAEDTQALYQEVLRKIKLQ